MITPETPMSRLIALLLLCSLMASIFSLMDALFFQPYKTNNQEIANLTNRIAEYQKRTINLDQANSFAARLHRTVSSGQFTIQEHQESTAVAKLQAQLKKLIKTQKGSLLSSQIIRNSNNGTSKQLTLRVQSRLSPKGLRTVLHALETQEPYLYVEHLTIQPIPTNTQKKGLKKQELKVEFNVHGFMKG
mgnify:CR=1